MPPVPPVEPAPLTPPADADAGIPSAARSRRMGRPAGARKRRLWRIALVLATAALSAGTLVAVHNATDKRHPNAAKTNPHQVQSRSGLPGPSGVPMPTGNLPGWQLTYSQDFSGTTLPSGWDAYSGEPGSDPYG